MKSPNEITLTENEQQFLAEAIRHAKELPFAECRSFLNGMIMSLGGSHPARARLSLTIHLLDGSDAQMDLIQLGQLKLDLKPGRDGGAK